jgi:hypothetical protein
VTALLLAHGADPNVPALTAQHLSRMRKPAITGSPPNSSARGSPKIGSAPRRRITRRPVLCRAAAHDCRTRPRHRIQPRPHSEQRSPQRETRRGDPVQPPRPRPAAPFRLPDHGNRPKPPYGPLRSGVGSGSDGPAEPAGAQPPPFRPPHHPSRPPATSHPAQRGDDSRNSRAPHHHPVGGARKHQAPRGTPRSPCAAGPARKHHQTARSASQPPRQTPKDPLNRQMPGSLPPEATTETRPIPPSTSSSPAHGGQSSP